MAVRLGVLDSVPARAVDFATRALPRLEIGKLQADQLSPVAVFDAGLLNRVTDHIVLGLIGYAVIRDRILWIDYAARRVVLIPAGVDVEQSDALAVAASRRILEAALSTAAVPCRFRMTTDGKIMLRSRVTPHQGGQTTPWLNLVLDTGASKSTLFEDLMDPKINVAKWSPALKGLAAPTLLATSTARLSRVKRIEVQGTSGTASTSQTEVALLRNPIAAELAKLAGEPIHGLLGYSFLQRFRVAVDYPHRVLWLDPDPDFRDPRPYEHSHVGLQLERDRGMVRVAAVVEGSPAAQAGIKPGDEITAVDGKTLTSMNWVEVGNLFEGPAGTEIELTVRHGGVEKNHRLRRRQLL
ncbi:MAG TPA: PDZ domain-containing protein [Candidatus Eisenbacteria bacterium]|nr:PDZ domain-containing protein [Candidatus Eisenbacteria bacterium]